MIHGMVSLGLNTIYLRKSELLEGCSYTLEDLGTEVLRTMKFGLGPI
jgi:hypothetical protein